jgi:hypothetical protein
MRPPATSASLRSHSRPISVVMAVVVVATGLCTPLLLASPAQAQPPWNAEIRAVLSAPAPVPRVVRAKQRRLARRLALRERRAAGRHARLRKSSHGVGRHLGHGRVGFLR